TEKIVSALCGKVRYWVTINEPLVYVYHAYVLGAWPPQQKSLPQAFRVIKQLESCHIRAYEEIHSIYEEQKLKPPKVSIAKNLRYFTACKPGLKNRLAVHLRNKIFNFEFLEKLKRHNAIDFIGINYYTRDLAAARGWGIKNLLLDNCGDEHGLPRNSLGWEIYPEGLYNLLLALKKFGLPGFILENGICTGDDSLRWDFIRRHLVCVHRAIEQGASVLGYLYWSLLDNYEWDKGFGPRFGLIEMDYSTFGRTVRESAKQFSKVCKTNKLEDVSDK
ncbi:MAG: family 1 glycosylhydrolase, partial [Candidatus Omnitrophica bacterium]|nr:family 1 glycosylhydrolase [Candidatus Omnitrophota bacterium]